MLFFFKMLANTHKTHRKRSHFHAVLALFGPPPPLHPAYIEGEFALAAPENACAPLENSAYVWGKKKK
jgi:hypothetical protein